MKKLLASLILLLSIGCSVYKPPKNYDIIKEMTFEKNFDEVWNSAIEWFATQGTPIKNMDKSSGFISTEYSLRTNQSGCLDCGTAANGGLLATHNITDPTGNFNILIKKISDTKTKVTVNCFFKAISTFSAVGKTQVNSFDCVSTGLLEKEILDYLGNN